MSFHLQILTYPLSYPNLPHAHDLTIAQSSALSQFNDKTLDQIFDENDLDYEQIPEALFWGTFFRSDGNWFRRLISNFKPTAAYQHVCRKIMITYVTYVM